MNAKTRELWRSNLIQSCLKIARNDKTLRSFFNLNGRREWTNADLMLLGGSLVGNTTLMLLTISMHPTACMQMESNLGAMALRQGVAESNLLSIRLVGVCCQLQTSILEGVAAAMSSRLRYLTISFAPVNMPCLIGLIVASNGTPCTTGPTSQPLGYLTRLNLINCKLDNFDVLALSLALADNPWLRTLSLSDNFISNIGVAYFCQNWRVNSPLQLLDLSNNQIGANGAQLVMTTTTKHPVMRVLLLNFNSSIGHEGLQLIGEQLPHLIALRYLGIQHCAPFGTDKSETQASACRALADGLMGNTSLVTLRVGGNKLGAKGAQMLMRAITDHPRLKRLLLKSDESIGLPGLILIGLELPFVKLEGLQLDAASDALHNPRTKLARKAGQALLQGVQRNHYLTEFSLGDLDEKWMIPIQFHVDLNQTCRPLLSKASTMTAVWPYIFELFYYNDKISHMYFVLLEQPWLVNSGGNI